MKKSGPVSRGKSGTSGHIGKSTGKVGPTLTSSSKLPSIPSASGKSYTPSSFNSSKSNKSSTTFGIIWLPGRKKNKHKNAVYNTHKNERPGERTPSMYNFMSGDSSNHQPFLKKKEEESDLLVPERSTLSGPVAIASAGAVAASELPPDIVNANPEEKQDFIKGDKDDGKEAAGDTKENQKDDKEYLENNEIKSSDTKLEKDKLGDNVDSVFLRSPPPHKQNRSTASTVEEEDCGIKCLYYTLQCCDCVLM